MELGQIIELDIHDLSHDARGLGRYESMVVFVEAALPKQKIKAKITKIQKKFAQAELLEVIKQADYFQEAYCPHQEQCGACTLQNMPYEMQLEWKQKNLLSQLQRIGKIQIQTLPEIIASEDKFFYRNKMTFAFSTEDKKLLLGLKAKASHDIVEIKDCKLIQPELMKLVNATRTELRKMDFEALGLRYLVAREGLLDGTSQYSIEIITYPTQIRLDFVAEELSKICPEIFFSHSQRASDFDVALGEKTLYQNPNLVKAKYLSTEIADQHFDFSFNSFMQVNTKTCAKLYNVVKEFADLPQNAEIWDLYCGIGAIALYLSAGLGQATIFGLDTNKSAISCAKHNANLRKIENFNFQVTDADLYFKAKRYPESRPDLIVLDPARSGLTTNIIQRLKQIKAKKVIIVSCDPASLARDLALLAPDYTLSKVQAVDMFPQTPHLETVALLERK